MSIDRVLFQKPPAQYRVRPMTHGWPEARKEYMQALKEYGFGGVVTNVPHENGFTQNPENLKEFQRILDDLKDAGLSYWIYDENGYPSGYGGGLVLEGHPELEAKGFYMRRKVAYEKKRVAIHLDEESDKIVWAAKYPFDPAVRMDDSLIQPEKMVPVPFTDQLAECDLDPHWVLYAFISKPAYEGSHCTHNVCSYSRYINVMNPDAVRRFIDLCFEPIAKLTPEAYPNAEAVFTDEPSLQVQYARGYEMWPYALAPWEDRLFQCFEEEYGFDLRPYLPYLFEPISDLCCPIRVKFYSLVGKMIARAYSGQLASWCKEHGTCFSGHYLAEEAMVSHVGSYGSYMEVVKQAGYPGLDVLNCYPEIYHYQTAKHVEMISRKKGTNGAMVEICPFSDLKNFQKDPIENMTGTMNLLYLSCVRVTNSYYRADFSSYDPQKFGSLTGYMNLEESNRFNEYVGRLGYMLDHTPNDCSTFVYYGIEDVQAKTQPSHTAPCGEAEWMADHSTTRLTKTIYEAGFDYNFCDQEDLADAVASLANGEPEISGCRVQTVLVPKLDVMYDSALKNLVELQKAGVVVQFLDQLPTKGTELDSCTSSYTSSFAPSSLSEVLEALESRGDAFTASSEGHMILKARYQKEGKEMYFVVNNSRSTAQVQMKHTEKNTALMYCPLDGSVQSVKMGDTVEIPSFRGVFLVFD